jgi:hypothetical protein
MRLKEKPMNKSGYVLSAAALMASTLPAAAALPPAAPADARPAALVAARATGLTAADLIVGRDGTVAVELSAKGIVVADTVQNSGC